MVISTTLKSIKANLKKCYDTLGRLKAELPEEQNIENLAAAIRTIPAAPAPVNLTQTAGSGDITIYNKWKVPIIINDEDTVEVGQTKTYTLEEGQKAVFRITSESGMLNEWATSGNTYQRPIVSRSSSSIKMSLDIPSIKPFLDEEGNLPNYSFYYFCYGSGGITEITPGSISLKDIKKCGNYCFNYFHSGSFGTSSEPMKVGEGALDFSGLVEVGNYFCRNFNAGTSTRDIIWEGKSLNFDNLTTVGNYFCAKFNDSGRLSSLPEGSFNTENIQTAGDYFFEAFNNTSESPSNKPGTALIKLPERSFRFDNLETVGNFAFEDFNAGYVYNNNQDESVLLYLPEGSFNFDNLIKVGTHFCYRFNYHGSLVSLPEGSFNTENIQTAGTSFLSNFNSENGGLSRGDGKVKIYAVQSISSTGISDQPGISQGNYLYVNSKYEEVVGLTLTHTTGEGNITIHNKWLFPIIINDTDVIKGKGSITYTTTEGDNQQFVIKASPITFSQWRNVTTISVADFATGSTARLKLDVPSLVPFLIDGTKAGDNFMQNFISKSACAVSEIAEGSFDTSMITEMGDYAFSNFCVANPNKPQLPAGSFRFDSLTKVGNNFCAYFMQNKYIEKLPEGSFNTEKIQTAGNYFFHYFCNRSGSTSSNEVILPVGSFRFDSLTTVGDYAFDYFNAGASNYKGFLDALPEGSFNFDSLTNIGNFFCYKFNYYGMLTALPEGSFRFNSLTTVGNSFCANFNERGTLTFLPVGSFNFDNFVTVGSSFCVNFNDNGKLITLPVGSFNTDNIQSAGSNFFYDFNTSGDLVRGDDGVKIKAINGIGNFNVSGQTSITQGDYAYVASTQPVVEGLSFTVDEGSSVTIYNHWGGPIYVNGTDVIAKGGNKAYSGITPENNKFTISAMSSVFKEWRDTSNALCYSTASSTKCTLDMTNMSLFVKEGGVANNYFCCGLLGSNNAITNFTEGTLDTSVVVEVGNYAFANLFYQSTSVTASVKSKLQTLPEGMLDISNIKKVGDYFFYQAFYLSGITSLPAGFLRLSEELTEVSNYFFYYIFSDCALISLPEDSFNTENIQTAGDYFFAYFNSKRVTSNASQSGFLAELPEGSFRFDSLITVGGSAFYQFNGGSSTGSSSYYNKLETLPEGSFNFDSLTTVGERFCSYFNYIGSLIALPAGSFNTESIQNAGNNFFYYFNGYGGRLTWGNGGVAIKAINSISSFYVEEQDSIAQGEYAYVGSTEPEVTLMTLTHLTGAGTVNIRNKWKYYVHINGERVEGNETKTFTVEEGDNQVFTITAMTTVAKQWGSDIAALATTPAKDNVTLSLNIPTLDPFIKHDNSVGDYVLSSICYNYGNRSTTAQTADLNAITEITGNLDMSKITKVGTNFCAYFNYYGRLTSLPAGSFNTENIQTANTYFFRSFNTCGDLTFLPEGSFRLDSLQTHGGYSFYEFNSAGGYLTHLPEGSFNNENAQFTDSFSFRYFNSISSRNNPSTTREREKGHLVEGNRGIKIYAHEKIYSFSVGDQVDIAKGDYGYVSSVPPENE